MWERVSADDFKSVGALMGRNEERGGWEVCEGYAIRGSKIVSEWSWEDLARWKVYSPLNDAPDLFLRFAKLYEAPSFGEAALSFTRRYGLPDGTRASGSLHSQPPVPPHAPPYKMDLAKFESESRKAWIVLELYEAFLNHDRQRSRDILADNQNDEAFHPFFNYLHVGKQRVPPQELVCALMGSVTVTKGVVDRSCRQQVSFAFDGAPIPDPSCVKLHWAFDNLLGAMYLQMFWLMTSGGELSRCEHCGRIMSLARPNPEGRKRRRDKRFCDDACRQARHRSKKKA